MDHSIQHIPSTEEIDALRKGDKKKFEMLFTKHYPSLVEYVYRILHDREAAKDIVSEIFCQLWDERSNLDIRHSFQSYLYKMAYHKSISSLRHQVVIQKYIATSTADLYFQQIIQTPEEEMDLLSKDFYHYLMEAVDKLPPHCKEIFILSKIEHKSHQEIAEMLDISVKTIETQLSIALTRLRKELNWMLLAIVYFNIF